jgi:hypothetical protein
MYTELLRTEENRRTPANDCSGILFQTDAATHPTLQQKMSFSLYTFYFLSHFLRLLRLSFFSLFLFVRLWKWTLSQRVETCNGVKWRLASPGDSDGPAKPTLWDGSANRKTVWQSCPQGNTIQVDEIVRCFCWTWIYKHFCIVVTFARRLQGNIIIYFSNWGSSYGQSNNSAFLYKGFPQFCYNPNA